MDILRGIPISRAIRASGKRAAILALLSVVSLSVSCGPQKTLPKFKEVVWERVEIDKTPTLEDYPDADAVYLLDFGEYTIDKHFVSTRHVLIKILKESGLQYADIEIPFDAGDEVHNIQGRTIRKDGTVVYLHAEDIREKSLFPEYILFSDSKAKIFAMPGAEVGSVIEYSYATLYTSPFPPVWRFQRSVPVLLSTFALEVPSFLRYNYMIASKGQVDVEKSISHPPLMTRAVYKAKNVPAITHEPYMLPEEEVATRIYFSLGSLTFLGVSVPIEGDSWEIVGENLWGILKEKIKIEGNIRTTVRQLIGELTTDQEKIAKIYEFVQSKIRYVAIAIKGGKVVPHDPKEVFTNKYGDCKDKAILLITMLKAADIDAYPVLARSSDSGEVIDNFFSGQQFNHMIVAVPAHYFEGLDNYDDVVVEGEMAYSSSDDVLIFDATTSAVPFGQIPWYLEDTKALVIKEKESSLMRIPTTLGPANSTTRVCEVDMQDDGSFVCSMVCTKERQEACRARFFLQHISETERKEWFGSILSRDCPGAILDDYSIYDLYELERPLTLNYTFTVPQYAQDIESFLVFSPCIVRNPMVEDLSRKEREHAIQFEYRKATIDVINIKIPSEYDVKTVPDAFLKTSKYVDYSYSCYTDGEKVVLNKQFLIKGTVIPVSEYEELRILFEDISVSERKKLTLSPKRL